MTPGTSSGYPAASHDSLAMLPACGPIASTQPAITSSTAAGSTSTRSNKPRHPTGRRPLTGLKSAPDPFQAGHYRQLAEKIHNNAGKGIIPTPITMDELEDMLMEHGIMKAVDESVVGKTAAELAAMSA